MDDCARNYRFLGSNVSAPPINPANAASTITIIAVKTHMPMPGALLTMVPVLAFSMIANSQPTVASNNPMVAAHRTPFRMLVTLVTK